MLWKSDLPYIGHFELKNPDGWANCYKVEKDRGAQPVQLQTLPDDHHYDDHDDYDDYHHYDDDDHFDDYYDEYGDYDEYDDYYDDHDYHDDHDDHDNDMCMQRNRETVWRVESGDLPR